MANLRFRHDGTFRVLQMADVQDGPNVDPDTVDLIRAAIRKADPDLVVFTGDQIRGYDPAWIDTFLRRRGEVPGERIRAVTTFEAKWRQLFGRGKQDRELSGASRQDERSESLGEAEHDKSTDSDGIANPLDDARAKVRSCFAGFLNPLAEAGVPFAATYGNHDFQCGILADEQDGIYRDFVGCLNPPAGSDPLALEPGTFALPIASSQNPDHIAMSVVMVNSGDYAATSDGGQPNRRDYARNPRKLDLADSDGYGTPTPAAIAWLGSVQHELAERNGDGKPVPSIAFQHIPPQEFYDCLKQVPPTTPNAVEGARTFAGHCYVLDRDVCTPGSVLGESIGCADTNCGEVEAMTEAGGYFALFCGHDHKNAFVGHVDGLDLGYAPTCGFASYGPKSRYRGIRLFEFHESDPAAYVTRMLTYGELVGRYSHNEVRTFLGDHLVTDGATLRDQLRRPTVFAGVATVGVAISLGFASIIRAIARRITHGITKRTKRSSK